MVKACPTSRGESAGISWMWTLKVPRAEDIAAVLKDWMKLGPTPHPSPPYLEQWHSSFRQSIQPHQETHPALERTRKSCSTTIIYSIFPLFPLNCFITLIETWKLAISTSSGHLDSTLRLVMFSLLRRTPSMLSRIVLLRWEWAKIFIFMKENLPWIKLP